MGFYFQHVSLINLFTSLRQNSDYNELENGVWNGSKWFKRLEMIQTADWCT